MALDLSAAGAVSVTGNANLNLASCGIAVDSSSKAALSVTGNITITADFIDVVGNVSQTGNITLSPTPATGVAAVSDPLASVPGPVL